MKSQVKRGAPAFQPVEVTLVFESQVELDEFYSIVNFAPLVDATKDRLDLYRSLGDHLRDVGGVARTDELAKRLKKTNWFTEQVRIAMEERSGL